jgi:hypothetical protein
MHRLLGRLAIQDSVRHFSIAKLLCAKKLKRRPYIVELLLTEESTDQIIKMRKKASLARYHFRDDALYVEHMMEAYRANQRVIIKYFLRQVNLRRSHTFRN